LQLCNLIKQIYTMVYPFQRYTFHSAGSAAELRHRFFLLLEQKQEVSFGKRTTSMRKTSKTVMFSGMFEGDVFELTGHRKNGGEDLVKFSGRIATAQNHLKVEIGTGLTATALTTVVLGIVVAMVLAYGYVFIAERMSMVSYVKEEVPYLLFPLVSLYISLKRYNARATALMEQIIYWLELEEEE